MNTLSAQDQLHVESIKGGLRPVMYQPGVNRDLLAIAFRELSEEILNKPKKISGGADGS